MASIWKGSLALGLLNVPVELRAAVRSDHIAFRLLDSADNTPVKNERVRADDGSSVAWKDIVKGYEYEKNKFVILTDEDFEHAALEQTGMIDVVDFVPRADIDPRYFETPYFLVPGKPANRTYAVIREAMREMDCVGIGTMILRNTEHLVGVHVVDDALVLEIMRFANEVISLADYSFPATTGVKAADLAMARKLLASLQGDFKPAKYVNEYRANLSRIIKSKSKGRAAKLKHTPSKHDAKVLDLMERLKESLAQSRRGTTHTGAAHRARAGVRSSGRPAAKRTRRPVRRSA
jgi:DNA end-binding protein Ku